LTEISKPIPQYSGTQGWWWWINSMS